MRGNTTTVCPLLTRAPAAWELLRARLDGTAYKFLSQRTRAPWAAGDGGQPQCLPCASIAVCRAGAWMPDEGWYVARCDYAAITVTLVTLIEYVFAKRIASASPSRG